MPFCISQTCKAWLGGLISAASGAIGTAASTMLVAPETFNFQAGFNKVLIVAGVSGAIAILNFLKQSPLPGVTPGTVGKVVSILLCFFLLTGCAGVRTWTLEMSQEDLANAVVSRQVADNLISTWSLNSGVMTCGTEDFLPPLMAKKITAIDESVKKLGKWSEEDWAKGCFLGRRVNLTVDQAKALIDLIIPLVTKVIGK